jgi:predicted DNA-binding WGR domain protein
MFILISVIIGIVISVPMLNDTMFTIFMGTLGTYLSIITFSYVVLYKNILIGEFIYIRTTQLLLETGLYAILASQVHWGWGIMMGISLLVSILHLKIIIGDKLTRDTYADTVNAMSDNVHDVLNGWSRAFKRHILRMDVVTPESQLDNLIDNFKNSQLVVDEMLKHKKINDVLQNNITELKTMTEKIADIVNRVLKGEAIYLYKDSDNTDPLDTGKFWFISYEDNMNVIISYGDNGSNINTKTSVKHVNNIDDAKSYVNTAIFPKIREGYDEKN